MNERGSVTLVVAAALGLGAVLAAFAADVARISAARGRAQTAADAAALAAAQELLVRSHPPSELAEAYASRGGARLISCDCDGGRDEVVVVTAVEVTLPLLGQEREVRAVARAVVEQPAGAEGLQPWFAARVACLLRAVPGTTIVSGYRTREEQARLHEERPDLAALPGRSLHERGLAADLGFASTAGREAAHARAASCGLTFPIAREPWHVQASG